MTNRLKVGMQRLASRMNAKASSTITYKRKSGSVWLSKSIPAVIGAFTFAVNPDESEGNLYAHTRDFIVLASNMSSFGEPIQGDRVEVTDDEHVTRTYQVLAYNGEQPWRWGDDFNMTMRIHTQIISGEVS